MKSNTPPSGPTEQEVREHFGDKLKADAPLMRPAYTSIWALEDGTLLWDWRNGFADSGPKTVKAYVNNGSTPAHFETKLKTLMYVTGPAASGKTYLATHVAENACEISVRSSLGQFRENLLRRVGENPEYKTIVFTSQIFKHSLAETIKDLANELNLTYFNINLTRN